MLRAVKKERTSISLYIYRYIMLLQVAKDMYVHIHM